MARYGDLDELKLKVQRYMIPNDGCGTVNIEQAERWFLKLIDEATTADVVPKSEVEELKGELAIAERHEKDARALFKDAVIQIQNARQEVAREIFAEIEKESSYCVASNNGNEIYETKTYTISALKLAELKKKYTEEVK